ncbi:MAG: right-handed parallel beta-helix repeat-containing protein [Candidatus Omnitrophota bacterium]
MRVNDAVKIFRFSGKSVLFPAVLFLGMIWIIKTTAFGQDCSLPAPFDANAVYTRTIYLSPHGDDAQGAGTQDKPYRSLTKAAEKARPGTRILMSPGQYPPNNYIQNLRGEAHAPILICGATGEDPAVISGGGTGIQLSDPRYVILQNFTVSGASGNGVNIDDGGSYDTPAEYVILRGLTVRDIGPSGNHDGIKLSGLDRFRVENCSVINPGDGGSAIDMVGCHDGVLAHNTIQDCGSSGIQAKGGCARLLLYANRFDHAGQRAVNMGGSTGLPYFRPLDAPYEAANIAVWANVFIGAETPIAFVGCENGLFAHNTIYKPQKWVARILQETTGERFVPCRNNVFANNIVVFDRNVSTFVNIGPNTQPQTFRFANNLWFQLDNRQFSGPSLPVSESSRVIQQDPKFIDSEHGGFQIQKESAALGKAGNLKEIFGSLPIDIPALGDYYEQCYSVPAAIGAFSGGSSAPLKHWNKY